jgi:hypothetical protein
MEPQASPSTWPTVATTVASLTTAAGGLIMAGAVNIDWAKAVKSDKILRSLM